MFAKKPSFRLSCTRDFPPGCGNSKFSRDFQRDFPPGCGNSEFSSNFERDFPPVLGVGLGRDASVKESDGGVNIYRRRPVGAVKGKLGVGGECDRIIVKKRMGNDPCLNGDHGGEREKVNEILRMFRQKFEEISGGEEYVKRVDLKAMNELKKEGKISKEFNSRIGVVPGVEIGDEFKYRVELVIVGLHRLYENGIDHMVYGGKTVATCIVATEGHLDKMRDPNVLTYVGEGGKSRSSKTGVVKDQKLKGGNFALWNSRMMKKPVRVVKGFKENLYDRVHERMVTKMKYIYDGLYEVVDCVKKKGPQGNFIYEFKLLRCSGQPPVPKRT